MLSRSAGVPPPGGNCFDHGMTPGPAIEASKVLGPLYVTNRLPEGTSVMHGVILRIYGRRQRAESTRIQPGVYIRVRYTLKQPGHSVYPHFD